MIILHGINNCDTVRKTKLWFSQQAIEFVFHDFNIQGLNGDQLTLWCQQLGWHQILNKRGLTWRRLSTQQRDCAGTENAAKELMLAYPSLIKRPLIDFNGTFTVGYKPQQWLKLAF